MNREHQAPAKTIEETSVLPAQHQARLFKLVCRVAFLLQSACELLSPGIGEAETKLRTAFRGDGALREISAGLRSSRRFQISFEHGGGDFVHREQHTA